MTQTDQRLPKHFSPTLCVAFHVFVIGGGYKTYHQLRINCFALYKYTHYYFFIHQVGLVKIPGVKKIKTRLEWLCVDPVFDRKSLMEQDPAISVWAYKQADSLEKVTTVKRVARVFRNFTAQLRNKRNRSLIHRPRCVNCHWLKFVGCRQFSIFQRLSFSSLFGSGSC